MTCSDVHGGYCCFGDVAVSFASHTEADSQVKCLTPSVALSETFLEVPLLVTRNADIVGGRGTTLVTFTFYEQVLFS